jgi:hypothetical protein
MSELAVIDAEIVERTDDELIEAIRATWPDEVPSVGQVARLIGSGNSRAGRLRRTIWPDADTTVRRTRAVRTTRTETVEVAETVQTDADDEPVRTPDDMPSVRVIRPAPATTVEPVRTPDAQVSDVDRPAGRMRTWPVWLLVAPAFVAIWSGWVGLGQLAGFGVVHPLPGIWDSFSLNTAITLPIGVEAYAAFALSVWLGRRTSARTTRFAGWSALVSLILGAAGQVAYHLMAASGMTSAPWQITTLVACLPVVVLGAGAALAHMVHADHH